jgi:hypothetical protein
MPQKTLVALVITEDKEILLLKKKNWILFWKKESWMLPGAEPKGGESDEKTLGKKFKKIEIMEKYKTFLGLTPDEKDFLETVAYLAKLKKPYSKGLFKYADTIPLHSSYIAKKIITDLNKEGFL